jgi:hypothetical protein
MPLEKQVSAMGSALSVFLLLHHYYWLCKVALLADIFGYMNALNSALQGKSTTIFDTQNKLNDITMKLILLGGLHSLVIMCWILSKR